MSVESLIDRQDRPAYVRFVKTPIEDKAESIRQGRYVARDVDYAHITPPYSKDVVVQKVDAWLKQLDQDVQMERIPAKWRDAWKDGYAKWQNGQEMPLQGTAIRGWGVISPAQQENLIRMNILTIEDLAHINDEGAKRLGLGWLELKTKARTWLDQVESKGAVTMKMADLERQNANKDALIESLTTKVEALTAQVAAIAVAQVQPSQHISADDILPESEPVKRRRG